MTSLNSALPIKSHETVPGWTPELGLRLTAVVNKLGGNGKAGEIAGLTDEMISRYINGRAKPNAYAVAALARAANVSLDWLLLGTTQSSDEDRLIFDKTGFHLTLFGRIAGQLIEVFRQEGRNIAMSVLLAFTTEIYEKVDDLIDDEDDLAGAIRIEINRLRRAVHDDEKRRETESS